MADYIVERTQPTIYLDNRGQAINGYLVIVQLPEFDEIHELRVAKLDAETIKRAAEKLLAERRAIAKLSG